MLHSCEPEIYYKAYVLSKMGRHYFKEAQENYDITYKMDPGNENWTDNVDKLRKKLNRKL